MDSTGYTPPRGYYTTVPEKYNSFLRGSPRKSAGMRLLFDGPRGKERRDAKFMQSSLPVGILVQICQAEACLQLPAELFFQYVGKLNAPLPAFPALLVDDFCVDVLIRHSRCFLF